MFNLVYKELKLAINPFFYLLPLLLALLFFIPGWIYLLVFMYFFWISVPQIYSAYITNRDYSFSMTLPISKKDYVTSKIYALFTLEALHILLGVIFGLVHNMIYGQYNWFFDINIAFFGVVLGLFTVFNVVFLPLYFKTGYFFGKPVIYAIVVAMIYGFIFEFGAIKYQWFRDIFEGPVLTQVIILVVGVVLTVVLNWFVIRKSVSNYQASL